MRTLSENIRFYRESLHLTQDQLAERINVNRVTLARYEAGTVVPGSKVLARLAEALHVDVSKLLNTNEAVVPDITSIDFALSGEIRELTDDEKQDLLDYVRFKRAQKAKQEAKQ